LNRFIVSKAGQMVAGHHVPHNVSKITTRKSMSITHLLTFIQQTSCGIHQLAANRLEANFTRPEEFLPERWFDDAPAEFAYDRRDIYQPFSFGPRNCIGKP
jgi:cytochrome P450